MKTTSVMIMVLSLTLFGHNPAYSQISFVNMTDSCGLGGYHENGYGTALIDYDNDGDLDIFVVGQNGQNKMFSNIGNWHFENATDITGIAGSGAGWGVCFGDFDADFDEDIYVSCRDNGNNELFVYTNGGYLESAITYNVADRGGCGYAAFFAPLTKNMVLDLVVVNQAWSGNRQSCRLFAGHIEEPFTNVTATSGIADSSQYWDCGATSDYDNDNDLDILITGESTNRLYRNNGHGLFTNFSDSAGINLPRDGDTTGYGITWGDYDNDGDFDYYISHWHDQNSEMYRNEGDGTFTDVTQSLGLSYEVWCHSVSFGDLDNDGWIDLYAVTAGSGNWLYHNDQGISFTVVDTADVHDGNYGCGLSLGDIDWDGKIDMVVGHYHEYVDKVYVYKNNTFNDNNWVIIEVNGFYPNPDAIGARVRLFAGNLAQMREVSGGSGFGSQNMLPLHFGLGTASVIDSLIITYPGTHIPPLTYYNLTPNLIYELPEINIDVASVMALSPANYQDIMAPVNTIFKIANVGNVDAVDFWSFCNLIDADGRSGIDSLFIPYIRSHDSLDISFAPFYLPQPRQHYFLEELVQLPGDFNAMNDTITNAVYAGYSHDLACGQVISPPLDSAVAPIFPAVAILNTGISPECDFEVLCTAYLNNVSIYEEESFFRNNLPPLITNSIEFPPFTPISSGTYKFVFRTNLSTDIDQSNDTTTIFIYIPVGNCDYVLGDINDNGIVNGVDLLYSAQYLRGGIPPPYVCDCPLHGMIFAAGDVNGSCTFNGMDVSLMVNYFRGEESLLACPNCPPIGGIFRISKSR